MASTTQQAHIEVRGESILTTLAPLAKTGGPDVDAVLRMHGLADVQPNHWYPEHAFLDVLETLTLYTHVDWLTVGVRVGEGLALPPSAKRVDQGLLALAQLWQLNRRHDLHTGLTVEVLCDDRLVVTSNTLMPSDFEYGLIYAVVRRLRPRATPFAVQLDGDRPSRKQGSESCMYHVLLNAAALSA